MVWGAIAGLASTILGGSSSAYSANLSYEYSSKLQKQAQQWQENMSNTAHQREVKDLRSAGLNPILSAIGGSGASTPTGGGGSVSAPDADFEQGVASAMAYKQLKNETELKNSQLDVNKEMTDKLYFEAGLANQSARKVAEEVNLIKTYGPKIKQAELDSIKANTAKSLQDMENSKALTSSQVNFNNNSAQAVKYDNSNRQRQEYFIKEQSPLGRWIYNWTGGRGFQPSLRLR